MNNKILLSICVPTYNGGEKLRVGLNRLVEICCGKDDVEIIISNNGSTDNTKEILDSYESVKNLFVYHNKVNVGFSGNLKLLIDNYANGEYCWIIGDDDYLDTDSLDFIIKILAENHPPFMSVKHRCLTLEDFNAFHIQKNREILYELGSYFKCIDNNADVTNVLATFMSSHIFKLDRVRAVDKRDFGFIDFSNFEKTFPNSYLMTKCFHNEDNCCCIKTPLFTALIHPKSWDDKLYKIKTQILPEGYLYYRSLAKNESDLDENKRIIYRDIAVLMKESLSRFRLPPELRRYVFNRYVISSGLRYLLGMHK